MRTVMAGFPDGTGRVWSFMLIGVQSLAGSTRQLDVVLVYRTSDSVYIAPQSLENHLRHTVFISLCMLSSL